MPQITVRTTSTRLAPQQRERLAQELAALMVDVLARKPEAVLVGFESLDPQAWFAGGRAPAAGASWCRRTSPSSKARATPRRASRCCSARPKPCGRPMPRYTDRYMSCSWTCPPPLGATMGARWPRCAPRAEQGGAACCVGGLLKRFREQLQ